jgi:hypothetical protein
MMTRYLPTRVLNAIAASIGALFVSTTILCSVSVADEPLTYRGDVTDVRVIRRVEQHPYAGKVRFSLRMRTPSSFAPQVRR